MLRDKDIRNSRPIDQLQNNPLIRLDPRQNVFSVIEHGELVNDVDLIKRSNKPLLQIACTIQDVQKKNSSIKKQKIKTKPDLENTTMDLFTVIEDMHNSLQNIEKIEGLVFPLLKLDYKFIQVPDVKGNEKLAAYV
jgi:hypothetical protein